MADSVSNESSPLMFSKSQDDETLLPPWTGSAGPVEEEGRFGQDGVKRVEAVTSVWTMRALVVTYIFIYIVTFVDALQQQITGNLSAYVTSSFGQHSLLATTNVLASIIGGVSRLPVARIIDVWGRVEGFILTTMFCTAGLLLMAICPNVQTYAAAQVRALLIMPTLVLYWVGYNGMGYVIGIFIADTTSLANRMVVTGLNSTAYIATTFIGPQLAQTLYERCGFRWAFGYLCIIVPVMATPVAFMFIYNTRKARKLGLLPEKEFVGRSIRRSIAHHSEQFDVIGVILVVAAFSLILLPLTLAASSAHQWHSGIIISMLVAGVMLLIIFGVWEKFFATFPFLPFKYLEDRTVMGACGLSCTLFLSYYCWDMYFSSYLQVVHRQNIRDAGYILNIFTIGSCFWSPIVGLLIRRSGHFKWLALIAIPVMSLGTILLVHFRHPGTSIGFIVMCQVLIAIAGGTMVVTQQIAVMAAVSHNEVAVVTALLGLFSSIGGSIGQSISGSIWTNSLPKLLLKYLPDYAKDQADAIYGDIKVALSYPPDSPVRDGIVMAYGVVQQRLVITGACFMPIALVSVLLWRDIDLKKVRQTKGTVF